MDVRALRFPRRRSVLGVVLLSFLLQASRCPDLDLAKQSARERLRSVLDQIEDPPRYWRVHWKLLRQDTEVSAFDISPDIEQEKYTCGGWCVLFFLDLDSYAHFAHPTRILVYDSKPSDGSDPIVVLPPSEWWPTIREPSWPYPASVFNTVAEREDPTQVFPVGGFDGELPAPEPGRKLVFRNRVSPTGRSTGSSGRGSWFGRPEPVPPAPPPGGQADTAAAVCDTEALPVWAILVNGYDDASDTFDEDVIGMYSVLKGFGVQEDRIQCLSPFQLDGVPNCVETSEIALTQAFGNAQSQMSTCENQLAGITPHFLLFWSSHGGTNVLFCNLNDGGLPDQVWAKDLEPLVKNLEKVWEPAGAELEVTIVIEACESGTVGEYLYDTNGADRRILTSATKNDVSYRDVDMKIGAKTDPNPADAGSETIWGYVEAFGTASADTDADGKIDFGEAVQYAKDADVTFKDVAAGTPGVGLHNIGVWTPTPPNPIPVHGSWNTSARVGSQVAFTAPAPPAAGQTVKVVAGDPAKIEMEINNTGTIAEVGVLALRLFRNDESAPNKWDSKYYPEDNIRTTVMIPGLPAGQTVPPAFVLEIPCTYGKGDTMRLAMTLDSAQLEPGVEDVIVVSAMPRSEITLEVEKECSCICGWWRNLWD